MFESQLQSERIILPDEHPAAVRYRRWRMFKDALARQCVAIGGIGVILAIVLIFFYLLYVVYPLFLPASAERVSDYPSPVAAAGATMHLALEEQGEIAVRFTDGGRAVFFKANSGEVVDERAVDIPSGASVASFAAGDPAGSAVAFGLSDGRAVIVRHVYRVSYPNDVRVITPGLEYPLGKEPLLVDERGAALLKSALQVEGGAMTLAAKTADGRLVLVHFSRQESLFEEEAAVERIQAEIDLPEREVDYLLIDKDQRNLYLANRDGGLTYFDISRKSAPRLAQHINVVDAGRELTGIRFLNGDISLLVGDSGGQIAQWSRVRDEHNREALALVRKFESPSAAVSAMDAEQRRKGFAAMDREGRVGIYHSTAERTLLSEKVTDAAPRFLALSPRANAFLLEDRAGRHHFWKVRNEHPEVSWGSIWRKIWYESYPEPAYIWQSSSASNDFEPKFSLTPLVFGTLKAAFYAMLVAMPLAIMGAIYTGYFMAPRMRRVVKPSIEIMGALPTAILGFLAGLWLAPMVEAHLAGFFSLLLLMPVGVLLFAFGWERLPERLRHALPEGWDAALLIPVLLAFGWIAFDLGKPLEALLFSGDLRGWLSRELGIGYDQRNALVVGLAMGFAVIPTIFSISEDAIFSVPKHLTYGSLALGATPWQTMVRVVLLTASPGIFSAVMIGFGRAVGETMIVLMATGNTPVMDFSIFQGMRTLSANIAVEMPESEVDSTHYRVLFLAALVLFLFTFVFNTLAEIIRQRLRERYSSL